MNVLNLRHSVRKKHRSKEKKIVLIPFCSPVFSLCKLHIEGFPLRIEGRFILMMRTLLHLLANIYMAITTKKAQPVLKVPSKLLIYINWWPPKTALGQYHWWKLLYSSKFRDLFQLICVTCDFAEKKQEFGYHLDFISQSIYPSTNSHNQEIH